MKFWKDLCEGLGLYDLKLKQFSQGLEKEEVFKKMQSIKA